ncbi:hypothetical protein DITRI_Ditri03aG0062200 [Diplodiscus trichospermus]
MGRDSFVVTALIFSLLDTPHAYNGNAKAKASSPFHALSFSLSLCIGPLIGRQWLPQRQQRPPSLCFTLTTPYEALSASFCLSSSSSLLEFSLSLSVYSPFLQRMEYKNFGIGLMIELGNAYWYPPGHVIGGTVYPGLTLTAGTIWWLLNSLTIPLSVETVCVFTAPIFSACASWATCLLTKEVESDGAGLKAAALLAMVPSYISQSIASSYDNEAVAIFALILYFLSLYKVRYNLLTLNTGCLFYATLNSVAYFYMVCSWGGYTFIINLIPMHVLLYIVTGYYSSRLYIAYAPLAVLGTLLAALVPVVGFNAVMTSEHFVSFLVFIIIHMMALVYYIKGILSPKMFKVAETLVVSVGLVSEHQPPTWPSYFMDINVLAFLVPAGIIEGVLFAFIRCNPICGPLYCNISIFLWSNGKRDMTQSISSHYSIPFPNNVEPPCGNYTGDTSSAIVEARNDAVKTEKTEERAKDRPSTKSKRICLVSFYLTCKVDTCNHKLVVEPEVHCVWAIAEACSAPSIVLTSHSHDGLHVFDDFREAYAWLRHNSDVDDKVSFLCGLVGYPSDDINKLLWMVRIGGGVFPHIKEPDYLFFLASLHPLVSSGLKKLMGKASIELGGQKLERNTLDSLILRRRPTTSERKRRVKRADVEPTMDRQEHRINELEEQ